MLLYRVFNKYPAAAVLLLLSFDHIILKPYHLPLRIRYEIRFGIKALYLSEYVTNIWAVYRVRLKYWNDFRKLSSAYGGFLKNFVYVKVKTLI